MPPAGKLALRLAATLVYVKEELVPTRSPLYQAFALIARLSCKNLVAAPGGNVAAWVKIAP